MCIYFLTYKREPNWEIKMKKINETGNVKIMLKKGFSKNIIPMKRLEVMEAYKTLEIYITPKGNKKL